MEPLLELQQAAETYTNELSHFLHSYNLGRFITGQVDHMAIKMADTRAYEDYLQKIESLCISLEYMNEGGRRLATALLNQSILFGDYGSTALLEIMEPRPQKIGNDLVGFEHTEFYYPNLKEVKDFLDKRGVVYEDYANPFHAAVACRVNPQNQEVKFTNAPLADSLRRERDGGLLTVIK